MKNLKLFAVALFTLGLTGLASAQNKPDTKASEKEDQKIEMSEEKTQAEEKEKEAVKSTESVSDPVLKREERKEKAKEEKDSDAHKED